MRVSDWLRAAVEGLVFSVGFSLVAVFTVGAADAQDAAERFHAPYGTGATVSVATLRIPEKAWRHFAKAQAAAEHNHLAESDRETEKAIAIAPDFAAAYLLHAETLVTEHAFEAAIANVKEARRVEPNTMWAGIVLAGAYNGMHRYEDARLALQEVHGKEGAAWQAAYEAARAAIGLKDVEGALRWSAVALDYAPQSFSDAHLVRANAFLLARRWREAQEQMEVYLQSTGTQDHRAAVLIAVEQVKVRVREEEVQKVASR